MSLDAGSAQGSLKIDTSDWTAGFTAAIQAARTAATQIPSSLASIKKEVDALGGELDNNTKIAKFFGDTLGGLKGQQDLLKGSIISLIKQGVEPESAALQTLKKQYDDTTKEIVKVEQQTGSFQERIGALIATVGTSAAFNKLIGSVTETVTAFANAEKVADRLRVALSMKGLEDSYDRIRAFSSQMQQITGTSNEVFDQIAAELIASGKSVETVEKIMTASAGFAAATGKDMQSIYLNLSKTLGGLTGELGESMPALKGFTQEELKNGAAVDYMIKTYSGFIGKVGGTDIALNSTKQLMGDLSELIGSSFQPTVMLVTQAASAFVKVILAAPAPLKALFGIIATAGIASLGALVARTVVMTAAKWGLFGATMAVNSAMAVGNPLLWVGIAAVGAAVIATTALVVAKVNEAKAVKGAADVQETWTAQSISASAALEKQKKMLADYGATLDDVSDKELESTRVALFGYEQRATGSMREMYAARRALVEKEQGERAAAIAAEKRRETADRAAKAYADEMAAISSAIEAAKSEEQKLEEQITHLAGLKTANAEDEKKRLEAIAALEDKLAATRDAQAALVIKNAEEKKKADEEAAAAAEAEIEKNKTYWEKLTDSAREYFDVVTSTGKVSFEAFTSNLMSAQNAFASSSQKLTEQMARNETAALENQYKRDITALDKKLAAQEITQEEYDAALALLDEQKASRGNEIAKKQFEAKQRAGLSGIAMDAASSIMGWWKAAADMGPLGIAFGGVMTAFTVATAATQAALVAGEQFVPAYERGGMAAGVSRINESGGEIVNLPDGTMVIPNDISNQIARATGNTNTFNLSFFDGALIEKDVDLNALANKVSAKIASKLKGKVA